MATMTQATVNSLIPGEIPARLTARVIDAAVLMVIGAALGRQIGFSYDWLIATASTVLIYFVLADALLGTTLGKAAMRLQVTSTDSSKPTVKQALLRECFTLLGAIPFVGPLLAAGAWVWIIVTIRSSPLRQGIHDRWAGTRVVRR
jgi:uncharacterized RDD family membrane protein YckC